MGEIGGDRGELIQGPKSKIQNPLPIHPSTHPLIHPSTVFPGTLFCHFASALLRDFREGSENDLGVSAWNAGIFCQVAFPGAATGLT